MKKNKKLKETKKALTEEPDWLEDNGKVFLCKFCRKFRPIEAKSTTKTGCADCAPEETKMEKKQHVKLVKHTSGRYEYMTPETYNRFVEKGVEMEVIKRTDV